MTSVPKCFFSTLVLVVVVGCSTTLTPAGAKIRTVNESDNIAKCEFLGTITAKSPEFAPTPSQEAEYVMNDARNKVAAQGGTHMKVVTENHGAFTGATINAEAYECLIK
ncbi:DUF4156 domain-containing protein [Marinimicrobium locisalis]|uniref:DUF4156 domain-containing protein n=1 Tax=Marinimicrobium locisalis TaxID=546022 RepID=UPI0032221EF7